MSNSGAGDALLPGIEEEVYRMCTERPLDFSKIAEMARQGESSPEFDAVILRVLKRGVPREISDLFRSSMLRNVDVLVGWDYNEEERDAIMDAGFIGVLLQYVSTTDVDELFGRKLYRNWGSPSSRFRKELFESGGIGVFLRKPMTSFAYLLSRITWEGPEARSHVVVQAIFDSDILTACAIGIRQRSSEGRWLTLAFLLNHKHGSNRAMCEQLIDDHDIVGMIHSTIGRHRVVRDAVYEVLVALVFTAPVTKRLSEDLQFMSFITNEVNLDVKGKLRNMIFYNMVAIYDPDVTRSLWHLGALRLLCLEEQYAVRVLERLSRIDPGAVLEALPPDVALVRDPRCDIDIRALCQRRMEAQRRRMQFDPKRSRMAFGP